MKHAKTRSSKSTSKESTIADTSRSPNRTVDDSPGTEDLARRTDIRDPLRAPGQLPAYARGSVISTLMKRMEIPKSRIALDDEDRTHSLRSANAIAKMRHFNVKHCGGSDGCD